MFKTTLLRAATLIAAASAVLAVATAPASAFEQTWNSEASYRASVDFIPTTGSIVPAGHACGGGLADHYRIQVVKTSNSSSIWTSGNRETDSSNWHTHSSVGVQANNAYYMRWNGYTWYFAGAVELGNPAPCQGVRATW